MTQVKTNNGNPNIKVMESYKILGDYCMVTISNGTATLTPMKQMIDDTRSEWEDLGIDALTEFMFEDIIGNGFELTSPEDEDISLCSMDMYRIGGWLFIDNYSAICNASTRLSRGESVYLEFVPEMPDFEGIPESSLSDHVSLPLSIDADNPKYLIDQNGKTIVRFTSDCPDGWVLTSWVLMILDNAQQTELINAIYASDWVPQR
jgi:hypothetical protein